MTEPLRKIEEQISLMAYFANAIKQNSAKL